MNPHTAPTIDVSAFRKAMGAFPTGVTVVTVASGDGSMHGMTVNSFSSVSLADTISGNPSWSVSRPIMTCGSRRHSGPG